MYRQLGQERATSAHPGNAHPCGRPGRVRSHAPSQARSWHPSQPRQSHPREEKELSSAATQRTPPNQAPPARHHHPESLWRRGSRKTRHQHPALGRGTLKAGKPGHGARYLAFRYRPHNPVIRPGAPNPVAQGRADQAVSTPRSISQPVLRCTHFGEDRAHTPPALTTPAARTGRRTLPTAHDESKAAVAAPSTDDKPFQEFFKPSPAPYLC
jgi:hypothetical protein